MRPSTSCQNAIRALLSIVVFFLLIPATRASGSTSTDVRVAAAPEKAAYLRGEVVQLVAQLRQPGTNTALAGQRIYFFRLWAGGKRYLDCAFTNERGGAAVRFAVPAEPGLGSVLVYAEFKGAPAAGLLPSTSATARLLIER